MILKNLQKILIIIILFTTSLYAETGVYIKAYVNNEIITNHDILKEAEYLKILNPNLSNLKNNKILNIAKNSLITEIIKKNEVERIFDLEKKNKIINKVFEDFYKRLNYKNEEEFENSLSLENNYSIDEIKDKLRLEVFWNELIVVRYRNQVKINEKLLSQKIKDKKGKVNYEFLLSEIIFKKQKNLQIEKQINQIQNSISEIGFNNTANIFSIADSSKFGGKVGWIESSNLTKSIFENLKSLDEGQHTDVIQIGNNYLFLLVEEKRSSKIKINFKEELKKMIRYERNKQLDQFSSIYFNKIKINYSINEK